MMNNVKVSGDVVVVCLTVIILAVLGVLAWATVTGTAGNNGVLPALLALLGSAVFGLVQSLQVSEVKNQTNGNTSDLIKTIQMQAIVQQPPAYPTPPGPDAGTPPPTGNAAPTAEDPTRR